ncbi:MAG: tetratricopeptide repeat protein [Candidatus Cloacimonadota bacterium]|nr:MAG: tetratricopeptide repeat protein [Candidatus Cloacimonadota bacterium]
MKKIITLLFILLNITHNVLAWSPVQPDVNNRAYFHMMKGEEFVEDGYYRRAIKEFELAYKFSFDKEVRNNALRKKVISLMKLGNYKKAIEVIENNVTEGHKGSEFLLLMAECLERLNKTLEAIESLKMLITQEPDEKNKIFFETKIALLFLSLDSLKRAEKTFTDVLKTLQHNEDEIESISRGQLKLTMYSLGYITLKKMDYKNAEPYFEFLEKNFKEDEVGYKSSLYLGLIWGTQGKEKESFDILTTINTEGRCEISAMKGYLFYRNGSFMKAKEEFQSIENDTSISKRIKEMITILSAECYYFLKDYKEAVKYYRKYTGMVNSASKKKFALYGLAWAYFRLGKYSSAYAVLKDFLVLYPESPHLSKIMRLSALSLFYVGEHKEAEFYFTRLLKIAPSLEDKDRIYYLRGKSEFFLREYERANADFRKIISTFPNSRWKSHAMNMIARISFEKEEYLNAYNTYKKLLELELSPSLLDEVRFQTERCLLNLRYYRNPVDMNRAFVRKYPESPKSAYLQLEVAEYYFQLQKYWEAIREYERFLNLFPKDENSRFVLFKLAQSYSQIGYYEKSLDIYKELSEGKDEYAESAFVSMGETFFSNEMYKESIDIFKELTRRFPESNMTDYGNFIIGKNYLELNLPKEARVSFELVVKSKKVFRLKEQAKLLIAKTFYLEGKGEEYLEYLDNLIKIASLKIRAESYFLKAQYKKELGALKEAIDLYEKSSITYEDMSDRIRALYEAGLSAEELMLFDRALEFYKKALSISFIESAKFGIGERIKRIKIIKGESLEELK